MKVFLSYSSEDRAVAKELASELASAGMEAWDPAEAVFPGDNIALRVGKALEESDAMVVLISPKSIRSESVQHELQYALSAPHYKGRVVPVLVKPTKDVPWILKKFPVIRLGHDSRKAFREIVGLVRDGFKLSAATP